MKKNRIVLFILCLLSIQIVEAQTLYMVSRGAITENDSLKGYYFLYQGDKYDKHTNSYEIEWYNGNLILSEKATFLVEKGFEFVSSKVIDKRAYIHFRSYHRGLNGEIKTKHVESIFVLVDIDKNKVYKQITLPHVNKKMMSKKDEGMITDKFKLYYLQNNKILNVTKDEEIKNKPVIQLLNNNLDTTWQSWLNDDKYKFCAVTKTFNIDSKHIGILVEKGKEFSKYGRYLDRDFRILSLDKGDYIAKIPLYNIEDHTFFDVKSTFFNNQTNEYVIAGNYISTKAISGLNNPPLGIFIIKINLNDASKPIIDKKIYTWKKDFKQIGLDSTGFANKKNCLSVKKIIYNNEQISLVLNFDFRQNRYVTPGYNYLSASEYFNNIQKFNTETASLICSESEKRQSLSLPIASEDVDPLSVIKNDVLLVTLSNKLDIIKFDYVGGRRNISDLNFGDSQHIMADMNISYHKEINGITVLSLFLPSRHNKKATLTSLFYGPDKVCKSDQIEVSEGATWTEYYPAKPGYIIIVEYYEKEKKLKQRIEKFNY